MSRSEAPECAVEHAVNAALDDSLRDAEALLRDRLKDTSMPAEHRRAGRNRSKRLRSQVPQNVASTRSWAAGGRA